MGLAAGCLVALVVMTSTCEAMYAKDSPVKVLDDEKIKKMMQKDGVYLVEFFAPWCGHCKNLKPEWEKLATAMKGINTVAAIDVDANKGAGSKYQIKSLPTIKAFSVSKGKVDFEEDYKGERTAKAISSFGMKAAKSAVDFRLGIKKKGGPGGSKGRQQEKRDRPTPPPSSSGGFYKNDEFVVTVDSKNFDKTVKSKSKREDHWMVEFYAPWCGHCKNLKPAWSAAAKELHGTVNFAAVNCDDEMNKPVCQKFGVQGFPTLMYFGPLKGPQKYEGSRDQGSLVKFAKDKHAKSMATKALELTSQDDFEKNCVGVGEGEPRHHLCVVAFLPDILDTQAKGRNAYIQTLNDVSKLYAGLPYSYLWAAAGSQPNLESQFQVGGFGYPALVLYSPKKRAYATLKSSFTAKEIDTLVKELRKGKASVSAVTGNLEASTTMPWDGKDGVIVAEDEISLDDLKEL
ncbi:protein disulfide isomerase [Chloropicon primus]|nr:protein disulfide isomerase [Chloropicon primus]UPQ98865.1 protein disulfide isomerase [Chloropicon primus]|eukprot:QDZ19653.1 protein disulfide isomerase [Chloropicon primus]